MAPFMDFSAQQEAALDAAAKWLRKGDSQLFRLFGYAGTGKTTLAKYFAEHVDGDVQFAAFTGKAAQVLRSKGATSAKTIHSLIYRPRGEEAIEDEETGKTSVSPAFSLNRQSPVAKAALIVVDECSMVDEALGRDLMSFGTPILVLGDPGQLPPISGGGYFTEAEPDVLLTDVHRQAKDNPIVRLALDIREGKALMKGDYGDTAKVIGKEEVDQSEVLAADQVLVGTNRTRRRYNSRLRELKGFDTVTPQSGDKLVCLRNDPTKGLLNGSLWRVKTASPESVKPGINLLITPEDDAERGAAKIKLLKAAFESPETEISWQQKRRFDDFDYGYALTVHKSQGSQWDHVMLFDESYAFRDNRERWLYTAVTRAAEKLTVVK